MEKFPCTIATLKEYKQNLIQKDVDTETKRRIICQIKIWTSLEEDPPIPSLIENDVIPQLLIFSDEPQCDPKMLFDIAWIFGNICSCSQDEIKYMLIIGADDFFLDILSNPVPQIVEIAMWGLGNIAGEGPKRRDELLYKEISQKLSIAYKSSIPKKNIQDSFYSTFGWLLSQLSRGKPKISQSHTEQIIAIFNALPDILWGLSYLTDDGEQTAASIANSSVFDKIAELLQEKYGFNINHPALRVIANLASSSSGATNKLFSSNALKQVLDNFMEYDPEMLILRKEACWCLSNIAGGTLEQARKLIQLSDFPDKTIRLLRQQQDSEIQQETMWIVTNLLKQQDTFIFKFLLINDVLASFTSEVNTGDRVVVDLFFKASQYSVDFLLKAQMNTFESSELDKLVLVLHYFNTTMINLKPTLVTGPIRQQCRDLKDQIAKIKLKFNLPENVNQKVIAQ